MGRSKQSKRKHIGDRVLPTREPASEQGLEAAAVMQSRPIETGDVAEDVSIGRNSDSPPGTCPSDPLSCYLNRCASVSGTCLSYLHICRQSL